MGYVEGRGRIKGRGGLCMESRDVGGGFPEEGGMCGEYAIVWDGSVYKRKRDKRGKNR